MARQIRFTPISQKEENYSKRNKRERRRKRKPKFLDIKVPHLPIVELMKINEIRDKHLLATLTSWLRVRDTFIFVLKFSYLTQAQVAISTNDINF